MQPKRCVLPPFIVLTALFHLSVVSADTCPQGPRDLLQQELHDLLNTINRHNTLYEAGTPEISDQEYDALTRHQRRIERCLDSPQHVPLPVLDRKHRFPMGSLTKAQDPDDIKTFLNHARRLGSPVVLQPKIDGIAIELVYRNGRLVQALTRGQQRTGSGINLLPFIGGVAGIPQTLPNNQHEIVIHGELYAQQDNPHAQQAASPRHYVAGLINRTTPEPEQLKALKFFPWHWVNSPLASLQGNTGEFNRWGFPEVSLHTWPVKDLSDVASLRNTYHSKRKISQLPMDGVVLKLDRIPIQQRLGDLDGTPYWAIAWKFPSTTRATWVKDILWTVGRTGQVTIILELAPVTIDGVLISRVHVGPEEYFTALNIARNDTVSISLKGAATPVLGTVLNRVDSRKSAQVPGKNQFNGMTCLHYTPECDQQFLARVVWLTGANGLNLPAINKTALKRLIDQGKILKLSDIYRLSPTDLPQPAIDALNNTRPTLTQALIALGIPGVGSKTAAKLAIQAGSWENIHNTSPEQLQSWLNCSDNRAKAIHAYLNTEQIRDLTRLIFP